MVWCTYCGQEFSRAEHLDRHVMTHTNVKPFKCSTCHFSFKRRDLLQRHYIFVHKDNDEHCSDQEGKSVQRRPIACVVCARAKTKCDKLLPSCSRCTSKGLLCEARSTKRSNDAAYRLAKRQLSLYRRPIPIAPSDSKSSTPPALDFTVPSRFFTSNPVQVNLQVQNCWTEEVAMPNFSQTCRPPPPTTPSVSGSDPLLGAPTPLILDGSDFGSPYVSDAQLHSSNLSGPGLDHSSAMPLSYAEPFLSASFELMEDIGYLRTSNNEQLYGTDGFRSCPTLQITDLQDKNYSPGFPLDYFITPQYHANMIPPGCPLSADSFRRSPSF